MINNLSFLLIVGLFAGWVTRTRSPSQSPGVSEEIVAARDGPTPVQRSRVSPSPSPFPPVKLTGRLELRSKLNDSSLGHVRNLEIPGTISGVNFLGSDKDLLVELTFNALRPTQINILATPGIRSVVSFTNVELTPPGAHPVVPSARQVYVESAIWSVDKTNRQLKAQWINNDGSQPPTVIAYDVHANSIFFVGDIEAYNMNNSFPASEVNLFLL
ncbi:hypothetical protein BDZ97DRAFT_1808936 [Flammula alnicola]|nr:hypothetical protein BDZ97DRAFT_1808936 [Flammula alnicola]